VERAFGDAVDHGQELSVETRVIMGATGRTGWLLARGVVERDEHGRAVRIAGVARDNTLRKEGEVVRRAQAQGERLRALGEMASGIAHDLNQSLALITGYSDMARQELSLHTPDLQRVREMVEITGQAAIEGGHALRGLLGFVRSQELMAEAERVDIEELLQTVRRLTAPRWRDAPQVEGRPIDLTVDAEPDCVIDGSPAALREAITNLIFNAVDALPSGGTIRLGARQRDDRIVVEVSDSGAGIPPDVRSHIFDPFFTTKGERGTGLGLPQVLGIVQRHGGTIDVDTDPGRGTTFKLVFPASAQTPVQASKHAAKTPAARPSRSIRVLVVEDEQQLGRMASLVLGQRGHQPTVAESGDEALGYLQEGHFDLVISDLGLGAGMNGWDLAEAVRANWPGTPFVLVTGWGAAIDLPEARARGVDRVIAKPYRIADLRQVADDVAAALDSG
jgi:signal transduction histidine kinase/ActR/RegA family two-component response regulator